MGNLGNLGVASVHEHDQDHEVVVDVDDECVVVVAALAGLELFFSLFLYL